MKFAIWLSRFTHPLMTVSTAVYSHCSSSTLRVYLWAVEDRRSLVELMAYDDAGGMSTRQIGGALDVDHKTVVNDLRASGENSPDEPRKVQSSDGRTRTYAKSAPREKTADERGCSQAFSSEISRLLP